MDTYEKFIKLIKDQLVYGAKKYNLAESKIKESTDVLFDKHGFTWLVGTMDKYTFRYSNLKNTPKAERDLLKISAYCYILWLKRGFHITDKGINDPPIDTNIEIKERYFDTYAKRVLKDFLENQGFYNKRTFDEVSDKFGIWSKDKWQKITENGLLSVFNMIFVEWSKNFSKVEKHDTDTFEQEKKV